MVSGSWSAIGTEERAWQPKISPDLVSARVRQRHSGPYRAAVVPEIAHRSLELPAAVATLAEDASVEIARFDAELGAEVAPFASVLLRSESASSSRIENLTSGAKSIALAELGSRDKRNATEIVGNVAAMIAALTLADRLDQSAILAMHEALLAHVQPDIAGRWREEQVWIGGDSFGPHGATFIPPHPDQVPDLMADLVAFTQRTDLPLLSQAAIAHAQFETIHPFPDGNGRTGRALIHAMLRGHGLTRNVTVPVSAGLLTDTSGYFDALTAYRSGEPGAIVQKLAEASFAAATNGRQLVRDLRSIRQSWEASSRRGEARLRGSWPTCCFDSRSSTHRPWQRELGVSPQNALRAVTPLVNAGILDEFTGFARNRMWQSREVLDALDDFAARAGRRGA